MGIQDNFWTIGEETVGDQGRHVERYENQTDDATLNVSFSLGTSGPTPDGPLLCPVVSMLTLDLMAKSLGLVFASVASTVATTARRRPTQLHLHPDHDRPD